MAPKEWTTHLPTALDSPSVDQQNLVNDPPDGDVSRVSQIHTVRDIANYCANQIGSSVEETGTLRKRVRDLESGTLHKTIAGEIAAMTEKTTPIGDDLLLMEDSEAANAKKKVKFSNITGGGLDTTAIHKATAGEIAALTDKILPVEADMLVIEDSENSSNKKRLSVGNLPIGSDRWKVYGQDIQYSISSLTFTTQFTFRVTRDSDKKPIAWRAICGLWSTNLYSGRAEARITVTGSGGSDSTTIYTDMGTLAEKIFAVTFLTYDSNCPVDEPLTVTVELRNDASGDTAYLKFFEFMAIIDTSGGGYGGGGG
jgi:hypothetical protein